MKKLADGTAREIIKPIYKDGVKSNPANYRPVGVNKHLKKIFEIILKKLMVEYLESNEVVNPIHHEFRHIRSKISQILFFCEDIISKLENGDDVDAIYLDFFIVFDKVDDNIVLHKIKALNMKGKILKWLETFLKEATKS